MESPNNPLDSAKNYINYLKGEFSSVVGSVYGDNTAQPVFCRDLTWAVELAIGEAERKKTWNEIEYYEQMGISGSCPLVQLDCRQEGLGSIAFSLHQISMARNGILCHNADMVSSIADFYKTKIKRLKLRNAPNFFGLAESIVRKITSCPPRPRELIESIPNYDLASFHYETLQYFLLANYSAFFDQIHNPNKTNKAELLPDFMYGKISKEVKECMTIFFIMVYETMEV